MENKILKKFELVLFLWLVSIFWFLVGLVNDMCIVNKWIINLENLFKVYNYSFK